MDDTLKLWEHQTKQLREMNRKSLKLFSKRDVAWPINLLHKYQPIISNYEAENSKTYISYLSRLFEISYEQASEMAHYFKGNVYYCIIFGMVNRKI